MASCILIIKSLMNFSFIYIHNLKTGPILLIEERHDPPSFEQLYLFSHVFCVYLLINMNNTRQGFVHNTSTLLYRLNLFVLKLVCSKYLQISFIKKIGLFSKKYIKLKKTTKLISFNIPFPQYSN